MNILKAFRLDKKITAQLSALAKRTCRTEKFYVEEALRHYFAEYEDCQIAKDRFNNPHSRVIPGHTLRKQLGV